MIVLFFVIGKCNLSVSRNRRPWVSRLVGLSVLISQRSTAYISPISWLGAFYFVCNLYEPMNHRRPISAHLGHRSNSFRGLFTIHILIFFDLWFVCYFLTSNFLISYSCMSYWIFISHNVRLFVSKIAYKSLKTFYLLIISFILLWISLTVQSFQANIFPRLNWAVARLWWCIK